MFERIRPLRALFFVGTVIALNPSDGVFGQIITGQDLKSCFYNINGEPMIQLNDICRNLRSIFGSNTPEQMTIYLTGGNLSKFDTDSENLFIAKSHFRKEPTYFVAHEAAHLAMSRMTKGKSLDNRYRFLDEGYATVVGNALAGKTDAHKQRTLQIASQQKLKNNISFALLTNWRMYSKRESVMAGSRQRKFNKYAYAVGASFIYFFLDVFDQKKLHDFFEKLPDASSLDEAFGASLGLSSYTIERRWLNYLAAVKRQKTAG